MPAAPKFLSTLVGRFEPDVLDGRTPRSRVRLAVGDESSWDVIVEGAGATVASPRGRADAVLSADARTWARLTEDIRAGMLAHQAGRMSMRGNLHLGVGLIAATAPPEVGRLRFRSVPTSSAQLSLLEAGTGQTVVALHGLGATKMSFLPTVAGLADRDRFRVIAVDLPGFGDSDKPIGAPYDARFFADALVDLLDSLALERVHLIGNSLGARVAMEVALRHPQRVGRLVLLAPSLAWRRGRPLLPLLRVTRPELGLVQLAPRPVVRAVVNRFVPDADNGWVAAGVDDFLRAYLTRSGRAAFYAAARQIYMEEPHGPEGFWTRLPSLEADSLFVWGRRDRLVPIAFARHVAHSLPQAHQLELECGHVPQVEEPRRTHAAIDAFLSARSMGRRKPKFTRARATRPRATASA